MNKQASALIEMIDRLVEAEIDDILSNSNGGAPSSEKQKALDREKKEAREAIISALTLKDDPGNGGGGDAERLRHIVSDCAAALVSGAFISPKASVEFMEGLPKEISLVVSGLRARCVELEEALEPFSRMADELEFCGHDKPDESKVFQYSRESLTTGNFAAIRALIPREAK